MMGLNTNSTILVIGNGASAILSAHEISKKGFFVWLTHQENGGFKIDSCFEEYETYFNDLIEKLKNSRNVYFQGNAIIKMLEGEPGNFKVKMEIDGKSVEEIFGAIVVATPYKYTPTFSEFNLLPSENILSINSLEKKIEDFKDLTDKIFVFLTRFDEESEPITLRRILNNGLSLINLKAKVYVVTRNLKVAAPEMEKLVLKAKEKGILIIKTGEKPEVFYKDKLKVSVVDSIIREKINILADFVIVEDEILPNPINSDLAKTLNIHTDAMGFLQSNNVRRIPVYSNRKGIFIVGSAVGIKPFNYIIMDSINVANEVSFLLEHIKETKEENIIIDHDKCVCCLTCYRVCPHGAVSWENERVVISYLACENCGTCAAECPMNAIQIKAYSDENIRSQINEIISSTKIRPLIIGFCCQNSAYEAIKGAQKLGYELPPGLKTIKVPCAGKIDIAFVLEALTKGADGVIIGACHNGNCKSEKGTIFAGYRIEEMKKFLATAGLNPDRICLINSASNMAKEFSEKVKDMEQKLKT